MGCADSENTETNVNGAIDIGEVMSAKVSFAEICTSFLGH
jgi:hypothetical protein